MSKSKFISKTLLSSGVKPLQALAFDGLMNVLHTSSAKFQLGRIVTTPRTLNHLTRDDILSGIARHQTGDWGCICAGDKQVNDRALHECRRVLSAYHATNGIRFWIITEADRSTTMVLLYGDY